MSLTNKKKLEQAISELKTTITYSAQWGCDPQTIPYNLHSVLQFLLQLKKDMDTKEEKENKTD
jgi:hypothetical protein